MLKQIYLKSARAIEVVFRGQVIFLAAWSKVFQSCFWQSLPSSTTLPNVSYVVDKLLSIHTQVRTEYKPDFWKLTTSYNRFTGNCFCLSESTGLIEQTSLAIPTYWFDFKKSSMKFNSIIIPCQATVNTSVFSFSAVDIQSVFFHFTAPLRQRFCRRPCPCYLRGWVSKEITSYLCFFTQKNSHFSWRRLGKSRCTCKVK